MTTPIPDWVPADRRACYAEKVAICLESGVGLKEAHRIAAMMVLRQSQQCAAGGERR